MISLSDNILERASKRGPIGLVAMTCVMGILGTFVATTMTLPVLITLCASILGIYTLHIIGEVLLCKFGCEDSLVTNGEH